MLRQYLQTILGDPDMADSPDPVLLREVNGGVATLAMNRLRSRNALSMTPPGLKRLVTQVV